MNPYLATAARVAVLTPHLLSQAVRFTYWHAAKHLNGDVLHDERVPTMSRTEAARTAMEMVMVTRTSGKDPNSYQSGMEAIFEDLDDPQSLIDVSLSLASMVSVVAEEEDLSRFSQFILRHEMEETL